MIRILPLLSPGRVRYALDRGCRRPGTQPMAGVSARLAARGWTVDTARTDSVRIRMTRRKYPFGHIATGRSFQRTAAAARIADRL